MPAHKLPHQTLQVVALWIAEAKKLSCYKSMMMRRGREWGWLWIYDDLMEVKNHFWLLP
jgi:hypothetical protein